MNSLTMIDMYFEIFLLFLSFFLSALYSASESALMSIPVDRVAQLVKEGGAKGRALQFLHDKQNAVLTTILVGNNLVNTYAAGLSTILAARIFSNDFFALSIGATTILILIFGEILPKTVARQHGEALAIPIMFFIRINYVILYPVVKAFTLLISLVLGKNAKIQGRQITQSDLEFLVNKAEEENTIDSKQIDLLSSILEFPRIKVKEIMTPRSRVVSINVQATFEDVMKLVKTEAHSRYPVIRNELEASVGILHIKDLFLSGSTGNDFDLMSFLKPAFFVYEHMKIQAVFDHMKRKKVHMALVKDENGVVVGLITLEDILEEIVGEIQDEHDDELNLTDALTSSQEGVIISARTPLRDLEDYNIEIPPNEEFSTLGGFLLEVLGNNFPKKGQIIFWEGLSFELLKVTENQIEEVLIKDVDGEKHFFAKS